MREVIGASIPYRGKFGLWLSLVERLPRVQEAVGSNPTSPIRLGCGTVSRETSIKERRHVDLNPVIPITILLRPLGSRTELKLSAVRGWIDNRRTNSNMGSLKKRRKAK